MTMMCYCRRLSTVLLLVFVFVCSSRPVEAARGNDDDSVNVCPQDVDSIAPCTCSLAAPDAEAEAGVDVVCARPLSREALTDVTNSLAFQNIVANTFRIDVYDDVALPSPALHGLFIRELRVASERLERVDATAFADVVGLRSLRLDLVSRDLVIDAAAFWRLPTLHTLELRAHRVEIAPDMLRGSPLLKHLLLTLLGDAASLDAAAFRGFPPLEEFAYSGGDVGDVSEATFADLRSLRRLNVSGSGVRRFHEALQHERGVNSSSLQLLLTDNELQCDCCLRWLLERSWDEGSDLGRCASPPALAGRNLSDLLPAELQCDGGDICIQTPRTEESVQVSEVYREGHEYTQPRSLYAYDIEEPIWGFADGGETYTGSDRGAISGIGGGRIGGIGGGAIGGIGGGRIGGIGGGAIGGIGGGAIGGIGGGAIGGIGGGVIGGGGGIIRGGGGNAHGGYGY
ncbi:PREDICTED: probable glycoprotein hormone G-protein coupled receptor [Priapulus caudatus]|uniref:Probable glycoprotein hormone G-protein coupled receptor n=1 Tax=Priapulus caudatus TaxID=37621 RepID=A0ABM1EPK3_PRICU|nr:PREDICTED: probable glycoprotein hormone G-protein coupled receptor [Priapulus caudatus]